MRLRLPSPALVIACLALLVGAGGVAYGTVKSTGQAVNIVDPTSASYAAKVDPAGTLRVRPMLNTSFSRSISVANFYTSFVPTTLLQTKAALAIDRVNFSVEDNGASRW